MLKSQGIRIIYLNTLNYNLSNSKSYIIITVILYRLTYLTNRKSVKEITYNLTLPSCP